MGRQSVDGRKGKRPRDDTMVNSDRDQGRTILLVVTMLHDRDDTDVN